MCGGNHSRNIQKTASKFADFTLIVMYCNLTRFFLNSRRIFWTGGFSSCTEPSSCFSHIKFFCCCRLLKRALLRCNRFKITSIRRQLFYNWNIQRHRRPSTHEKKSIDCWCWSIISWREQQQSHTTSQEEEIESDNSLCRWLDSAAGGERCA